MHNPTVGHVFCFFSGVDHLLCAQVSLEDCELADHCAFSFEDCEWADH